jgi:hypothetical protein
MKYASVLLLTFCGLAFGAEDCSEIADHQDRLSCYDFKFPRTETSPSYQKASVLTREVEVDATSIISNAEPVEANMESSKSSFWGFLKKDKAVEEVTVTVMDILNKDQQKMAFLLSNDEIWLQDAPRNLPIYRGDEVTIKKATLGGYIMRNNSGTSTRVSRIK